MKETSKLLDMISVIEHEKGQDHYFTAYCPFCGDSQDASVLGSVAAARVAAKGKVLAHIKRSHKESEAKNI